MCRCTILVFVSSHCWWLQLVRPVHSSELVVPVVHAPASVSDSTQRRRTSRRCRTIRTQRFSGPTSAPLFCSWRNLASTILSTSISWIHLASFYVENNAVSKNWCENYLFNHKFLFIYQYLCFVMLCYLRVVSSSIIDRAVNVSCISLLKLLRQIICYFVYLCVCSEYILTSAEPDSNGNKFPPSSFST